MNCNRHFRGDELRRPFRQMLLFSGEPLSTQKERNPVILFPDRRTDSAPYPPHQIAFRQSVENPADGNFAERKKAHRFGCTQHFVFGKIRENLLFVTFFHDLCSVVIEQ